MLTRGNIFLTILISFQFVSFGAAEGRSFSLKETLNYSFEHSPVFDSAKRTLDSANLTKKNALDSFLPSLDFTTTDGLLGNQPTPSGSTDPYSTSLAFTLNENLYDNGQSWTQFKISRESLEIASLNTKKARDKLCLDVATVFYQYSLQVKLLEIKKEQLLTLKKQLDLVNSQYQQGFKTKKDFLRLKSQVQRTEIDIINAQNDMSLSDGEIKRLMGVDSGSEEGSKITFLALEVAPQEPELKSSHLIPDNFYDYRIARLQADVNDLNLDLVKRNYWPQFSLKLSSFYSNQGFYGPSTTTSINGYVPINNPPGTLSGSETYGWSALFTLSYNIWDWGVRKNNIEIAENTKMIQDNSLKDGLLSVGNEIKTTQLQLQRLFDSYRIQKELLESETQSYEILRADYREGKIAYLDMITSLNDLLSAKVLFFTSYFDLMHNIARYHYFEGNLYEEIFGQ